MSLASLTVNAHAKINLSLCVLWKRQDGFHEIRSVVQRLSLCDRVTLKRMQGDDIVYEGPRLTERPEDNLVLRAARLIRERFQVKGGVHITLKKVIPAGAGLGGGSSDAAAVIMGLSKLAGFAVSREDLMELGSRLGSDVPFFIADRPSMLMGGRGERLSPASGLPCDRWVLIVWPGFSISTAWAYNQLDLTLTSVNPDIRLTDCQNQERLDDIPAAPLRNDFEPTVFAAHPELAEARDRILQAGALSAGLCGSGSALYGIFDGEAVTRTASCGWRRSWLSFVCRPF